MVYIEVYLQCTGKWSKPNGMSLTTRAGLIIGLDIGTGPIIGSHVSVLVNTCWDLALII